LAEHLDEYLEEGDALASGDGKLTKFPPDFLPVPCKPLFFDLAWNHVEFPRVDHKMEVTPAKAKKVAQQQQQQEQQQQQTGGLSGFVKGLWGWGSSK
jgi:signal recognition particle subunit SRP68